jgi:mycothiol synthase
MLRAVTQVSTIPCPVTEGQLPEALSLILASSANLAGEREIAEFRRIAAQRQIDLNKIVIAQEAGQILWAILPIATPGRTLLLISPNYLFDAIQFEPAGRLIDAVCAQHARLNCQLAQVLIDPAAAPVRALFGRVGFIEMAELIYLHAPVRRPKTPVALPANFYFEHYSAANHALFAQAIRESYRDSLDCPALNGLRDIEDVIQGHQAAGGMGGAAHFDPNLWQVLMERQTDPGAPGLPRGVLLLCRVDQHQSIELVYIGLATAIRGRGLGTLLLRQAMAKAHEDHRRRLTLAVDSRNQPALRLYYRHGFQKMATKIALIRDLRAKTVTSA